VTVITRKAYGGAYCVMSSKHLRTDVNFAFPTAEIAVMGPEAAVNIIYRKEIAAAGPDAGRVRDEKVAQFRERFANPWVAAEHGFVDEVIEPSQTRRKLIDSLRLLENKNEIGPRRKHGNIPL
jgi:propionyl-CoA carboxylase beta chain